MSEEKQPGFHGECVTCSPGNVSVAELAPRQETPRHELVDDVEQQQHLAELRALLERWIPLAEIARIIEARTRGAAGRVVRGARGARRGDP